MSCWELKVSHGGRVGEATNVNANIRTFLCGKTDYQHTPAYVCHMLNFILGNKMLHAWLFHQDHME